MKVIYYILAILLVLFIFVPFFWMFSTAVKPLREAYSIPPTLVPTNAALMAAPLLDTNQFEIIKEHGIMEAHISPNPINANMI